MHTFTRFTKSLLLTGGLLLAGTTQLWSQTVFINEIHYDNAGTDAGEAIEIAGPAGTDLTGWSLVLYNGANNSTYDTDALSGTIPDGEDGYGFVTVNYPSNGIQNGAPDGVALVNNGAVVQFLSYEGAFTAANGPASGLTSTDIGVSETGSETLGQSLQLSGTGTDYENFTWNTASTSTFGAANSGQSFTAPQAIVFINEIHYDNVGTDTGEAIEIAGTAGSDVTGWRLVLYNGNGGAAYDTRELSGTFADEQNGFGTLSFTYPANGIQNGSPDGIALINPADELVQFLSYEGVFTATDGLASGQTSTDIGVSESGSEPVGQSLQLGGTGLAYANFTWQAAQVSTFGAINTGQTFDVGGGNEAIEVRIYEIQGDGAASPLVNQLVQTGGVIVGDFQGSSQLNGFYMQDVAGDGNEATSDGIFVFAPDGTEVNTGDSVTVTGTVSEQFGLTQINSVTEITVSSAGKVITPVPITLPVADETALERYEGMLVQFTQALTVTENFNLGRFGELILSTKVYPFGGVEGNPTDGRLLNPTNFIDPTDLVAAETENDENNVAAVTAQQTLNNLATILLDDNRNGERGNNPGNIPLNSPVAYVDPVTHTLRVGSAVNNLTGILDYGFNRYRVRPIFNPYDAAAYTPYFSYAPRPAVPSVGDANLKMASFNVLNYFNGDGAGSGFPTSRGADTPEEFARQKAKIIAAISQLDADVIGLIEIENDGDGAQSAIADLVNGLNEQTSATTYAYVQDPETGTGTDEIKVAIIYKPAAVSPVGASLSDNQAVYNRLPVAQTFSLNENGEVFTFVVNHFKSKGSGSGPDADQGDGQGASNFTRTQQATALADFLMVLADSTDDADIVSVGDYNAYNQEDPIDVLRRNGYVSLSADSTYSYVFDGQSGSLDHALISGSLQTRITGVADWHINADEPRIVDYNTEFNPDYLYADNPYRSSDHDPVLVGLNLAAPAIAINFAAVADTVAENAGQYVVSLLLEKNTEKAETVTISLQDSSGLAYGKDYITAPVAANGLFTLTIPAGTDSAGFVVNVLEDKLDELNETLILTIDSASSGLIAGNQNQFALTITDNDVPVIRFAEIITAQLEGSGAYRVKLNVSVALATEQTVQLAVRNGAGVTGSDYTTNPAVAGGFVSLTIPAGSQTVSFTITPSQDEVKEKLYETVIFTISRVSEGLLKDSRHTSFAFLIRDVKKPRKPVYIVVPNPTTGFIRLLVDQKEYENETVAAVLRTSNGDVLYTGSGTIRQLESPVSEKLKKGRRGVYVLSLTVGGETYQLRILKI